MKIRASLSKAVTITTTTSNGGMVAKQASARQVSLVLGYDCQEPQLVLKSFYDRKEEEGLKSNTELLKLLLLKTQAGRSDGHKIFSDVKAKPGPKPKQETPPTSILLPKIIAEKTEMTTNPPLAVILVKAGGQTTFGDYQEGPQASQRYFEYFCLLLCSLVLLFRRTYLTCWVSFWFPSQEAH